MIVSPPSSAYCDAMAPVWNNVAAGRERFYMQSFSVHSAFWDLATATILA